MVDTQRIKSNESISVGNANTNKARLKGRKNGTKALGNHQKTGNNRAIPSPQVSVITLKVNGLDFLVETPTYMFLASFTHQSTHILRVSGSEKILDASGIQKKAGVTATVRKDKIEFKSESIKRKTSHYLKIEGQHKKTTSTSELHMQHSLAQFIL